MVISCGGVAVSEPWMVAPGPRLLSAYARVSGWNYTNGGRDVFPWPPVAGLPAGLVLPLPSSEPGQGGGQVCSTFFAGVVVRAYPRARWTTPDQVEGNLSTYARLQSWRMKEHLDQGGTVATAPASALWDPLDVLHDAGVATAAGTVEEAGVGRWHALHGWFRPTQGHVLYGFRFDSDTWALLESNTWDVAHGNPHRGPRFPVWVDTGWLIERYDQALMSAPLRREIPDHLRRAPG